jgi:nicotinamidase-related amidase/type 1 glutamine amidotransferase
VLSLRAKRVRPLLLDDRNANVSFQPFLGAIPGVLLIVITLGARPSCAAEMPDKTPALLHWMLQTRVETSKGSNRYHTISRKEKWDPHKTAVIVCDVWDLHHCFNAVRRVEEMATRLECFLKEARSRGVTIIHAPSDCMDAYVGHPARRNALLVPKAKELPKEITAWCSRIPAEERGRYPIDQSDGGEDDELAEHRAWADKLQAMGRNPKAPWKKQTDLLTIEPIDFVSDKGDEVWSILQHRDIDNVILTGVHTNMCVLGRPFGLRQMARNGKNVVLVRDLTDTMYNPERWPYVSHFTGTDRIIEHIEQFVCPTITSDQLLGGLPFRFKKDIRPTVALVIAEDEYDTKKTLPAFAAGHLGKEFRVRTVFGRDGNLDEMPGLATLDGSDILIVSARRRFLKIEQLAFVRRFVQAGKPVIGIRTASHAFVGAGAAPAGRAAWPEFDREVFGGSYHGHHDNKDSKEPRTLIRVVPGAEKNPLLNGLRSEEFPVRSWLYKTSPLAPGTTVLLTGRVEGREPPEPVAWTFIRSDHGCSFYTSLGHPDDFDRPQVQRLLLNSVYWAAGLRIPAKVLQDTGEGAY